MTDNELRHFGVLGMKWGVRKKTDSKENKSRNMGKKIAIGLGITAVSAASAYVAYNKVQKIKSLKISKLKKQNDRIYKRAGEFLAAYDKQKGPISNTSLGYIYGKAFVEGDTDLLKAIWDATGIIPSHK